VKACDCRHTDEFSGHHQESSVGHSGGFRASWRQLSGWRKAQEKENKTPAECCEKMHKSRRRGRRQSPQRSFERLADERSRRRKNNDVQHPPFSCDRKHMDHCYLTCVGWTVRVSSSGGAVLTLLFSSTAKETQIPGGISRPPASMEQVDCCLKRGSVKGIHSLKGSRL
jgi:hypothetical protein